MLVLTIALKSTDHQIVLTYKSQQAADRAVSDATQDGDRVFLADDFGKSVRYLESDVAFIEMTSLDDSIDGMVNKAAWRTRAKIAMMRHFERQPDLKPYIGNESIEEMFREG